MRDLGTSPTMTQKNTPLCSIFFLNLHLVLWVHVPSWVCSDAAPGSCLVQECSCYNLLSYFFHFFSTPYAHDFRLSVRFPFLVVTQIRVITTVSRMFSIPTTVHALHFYPGNISALSSLVDSRPIPPAHTPRSRSQQLICSFLVSQV